MRSGRAGWQGTGIREAMETGLNWEESLFDQDVCDQYTEGANRVRLKISLWSCRPACYPSHHILSEQAESISKTGSFNYLSHNIIAGRDGNIDLLCSGRAGRVE